MEEFLKIAENAAASKAQDMKDSFFKESKSKESMSKDSISKVASISKTKIESPLPKDAEEKSETI